MEYVESLAKGFQAAKRRSKIGIEVSGDMGAVIRSNERYFADMERCTKRLREIFDPAEAMGWLLAKQERLGGQSAAELIAHARTAEVERVIDELQSAAPNAEHRAS